MALLAYSCSVIFSFLYQFSHKGTLKFNYFFSRSVCDHCNQNVKPYDLLPILSYILLKGRARCCHKKLQIYYLIGEVLALIPIFLYYFSHGNINFSHFLLTFLFLLSFSIYDINNLSIDIRLSSIYVIVAFFCSHLYLHTFIITFLISQLLYLILRKYIGYGDIVIFNMLSLFLPLNFLIYLCMFTFIFGGFISIFIKLLINKDLKYIPLIPFVFLSFIFTSLFYNDLNIVLGGTYY